MTARDIDVLLNATKAVRAYTQQIDDLLAAGEAIVEELHEIAAVLDGVRLGLLLEPARAANQGGTEQATRAPGPSLLVVRDAASVVALPVAPALTDATAGASTVCMFGTPWCPDKDGRVCADCAEFNEGGTAA